jgi:hypothetical protein
MRYHESRKGLWRNREENRRSMVERREVKGGKHAFFLYCTIVRIERHGKGVDWRFGYGEWV